MALVEKSDASRLMALSRMFPKRWGTPPYDDEERRAWILTHARTEQANKPHRELAQRDIRLANNLRRVYLDRIKDCP